MVGVTRWMRGCALIVRVHERRGRGRGRRSGTWIHAGGGADGWADVEGVHVGDMTTVAGTVQSCGAVLRAMAAWSGVFAGVRLGA